MPATPPPPDPRFRKAARVVVLLGDDDGSRPTISDRCDYLIPTTLTRDFGGGTLDSIHFRFDLDRYGSRLQDTSLPSGHNRIVEVRIENPATGELDQILGWGKLARQPQSIGENESVGFVARLDHFLFGTRLSGYPVRDPNAGNIITVKKSLTFNPVIDDARLPNRSDMTGSEGATSAGSWDADTNSPTLTSGSGTANSYYTVSVAGTTTLDGLTDWEVGDIVFFDGTSWQPGLDPARLLIDPDSLRTTAARQLHGVTATRWDLATAVERLCWTLNRRQRWFKNPTLSSLQSVLGTDTPLLENHTIPLDASLPEALDQLLNPHGYTWFVEHAIDTSDATFPLTSTITVAERGAGDEVTLRLQRRADTIDSSKTNIDSLSISYDIAARPNVIVGRSALAMREGTFPLRPCWPKSSDTLSKAELTKEYKEHDREHIDVFRKFVFDTAGDYVGLRDDFGDQNKNLTEFFDSTTVPIRRKFHPALSQGRDRRPIGVNGYLVEWHNGTEWKTIPWSFSVLEHEAGILLERGIDENFRTEFLKKSRSVAAGEVPSPILRITCCLEGDSGTTFTAQRRDESANGSDFPRHYDLAHKFRDARVREDGDYASVLYYGRHDAITGLTFSGALGGSVEVATDLTAIVKEGDRVNIINSTDNDGVYHVASLSWSGLFTTIVLREPIISDTTVDGVLAYLTHEEWPLSRMTRYVEDIQAAEDFVVIHADATLFGIDHPEYRLGQVITKVEQRNLSLDSYAAAAVTQRHPQITRLTYQLDGKQTLSLVLDQFDRTSDRMQQRLRTK